MTKRLCHVTVGHVTRVVTRFILTIMSQKNPETTSEALLDHESPSIHPNSTEHSSDITSIPRLREAEDPEMMDSNSTHPKFVREVPQMPEWLEKQWYDVYSVQLREYSGRGDFATSQELDIEKESNLEARRLWNAGKYREAVSAYGRILGEELE
jgi:hypothetical protein